MAAAQPYILFTDPYGFKEEVPGCLPSIKSSSPSSLCPLTVMLFGKQATPRDIEILVQFQHQQSFSTCVENKLITMLGAYLSCNDERTIENI